MPQNRNSTPRPAAMTWARATPVVFVMAPIFDLLRIFFEQFWLLGPALAAVGCTAGVNTVVGSNITEAIGKGVAVGCAALAGTAGFLSSGALVTFGMVIAMSIGLLGWLILGLYLVMTNGRIFRENATHGFWYVSSLGIAVIPLVNTIPSLTAVTFWMYRTQIRKEQAALKKWKQEDLHRLQNDQRERAMLFAQARERQAHAVVQEEMAA